LQALQAQYAEDALRYSQLGLGVSARELGWVTRPLWCYDYSALFWNPAGLALERDNEFSIGLSNLGIQMMFHTSAQKLPRIAMF